MKKIILSILLVVALGTLMSCSELKNTKEDQEDSSNVVDALETEDAPELDVEEQITEVSDIKEFRGDWVEFDYPVKYELEVIQGEDGRYTILNDTEKGLERVFIYEIMGAWTVDLSKTVDDYYFYMKDIYEKLEIIEMSTEGQFKTLFYTYMEDGIPYTAKEYQTIYGFSGITLRLMIPTEAWSDYEKDMESILKSLKLKTGLAEE